MPRIHLLGFPHTETTKAFSWCAFTEKTRKEANMLHDAGWDVRLYAGEENEARCTEHIPIVTRQDQAIWFAGRDWAKETFDQWDDQLPYWQALNARAIYAIRQRMEPGDILGLTMGWSQKSVAEALPELIPVEVGVGYWGVWAPYRVYESYALRHFIAGRQQVQGIPDNERTGDIVIPNSFEAEDFPPGPGDGGYYLMVCRFIRRKGIERAVEATRAIGAKLIIAGNGCTQEGNTFRGIDLVVSGDHIEHVGVVGPAGRARLMGGAIATFCPSMYLEAFCGVHAESMMAGTPVITSDWGAFTETVRQGVDGWRCSSPEEYISAAQDAPSLDRHEIAGSAYGRFSTDTIRWKYDEYLRRVLVENGHA
jgi:glycosyltransferase involved in cell wall biosynthesis